MAEAHLPELSLCFAFLLDLGARFLFPGLSFKKQPELGEQHVAQLPITIPTQRRRNSESLKI
jgi:hypothetical protein